MTSKSQVKTTQETTEIFSISPMEIQDGGNQESSYEAKKDSINRFTKISRLTKMFSRKPKATPEEIDINVMSINNPPKNKYRFISACIWEFVLGMSDGVIGGILPSIEEYYNVNYAIVSLIWMGNALGFITIAFVGHRIDDILGLERMPLLSTIVLITAFSIFASGVKIFPLVVVASYLSGTGAALALAQFNIFLTKLHNPSKYLGLLHGCYGLGGFAAPLMGTLITSNVGYQAWHYFYMIPLGISVLNFFNLAYSYNGSNKDLDKWYNPEEIQNINEESEVGIETSPKKPTAHDFVSALKNIRTWYSSAFIFFYQGSEVALGGWVVTFLLDYRESNKDSTGYVSSGFWGGVTLGRFALTHLLTKKIGVRRSIILLSTLLILLDLLVWLIPNTIAAATFASIMGFLIGPIYPMMISIVTEILPRKIRFCGILIATAFGSSGGSVIPFLVGLSSEYVGTFILHPVFIASYVFMSISWILMPNIERKGAIKNIWQRLW